MPAVRTPINIAADKRVPWGGVSGEADMVVLGADWSAGTFAMQLRNEPGDTGTALVSLTNASPGAQGTSASYDAGYLHPETGVVVGATIIRPQINETTIEALALDSDPAKPLVLHYDIHATISGIGKFVLMAGTFTIKPGVTI